MSSNVFITPRSVTTIARGRIDHNTSLQALLQNFASNATPVAESVNLEGAIGLQTGMLWYKAGPLSDRGEGRLLVYDGTQFTRTGIAVHRMSNTNSANSAAISGFLERGDLVDVGDNRLYMVNASGTSVFDVGTIPPTADIDADTLDGVTLATIRSEFRANDGVTLGLARANDYNTYTTLRAEYRANDGVTLGLARANDGTTLLSARANDYNTYTTLRDEYRANDYATWTGLNSFVNLKANSASPTFTGNITIPQYILHADNTASYFGFSDVDTFVLNTNGRTRFIANSNGSIGIGITSIVSNHLLTVGGVHSPAIMIASSKTSVEDGDVTGSLLFYNNDSSTGGGARVTGSVKQVAQGSLGRTALVFGTNTSITKSSFGDPGVYEDGTLERMRITTDGFVGIGTATPGTTLEVNGTISCSNYYVSSGSISQPSFTWFSDPNTGIYRHTEGSIGLTANATLVAFAQESGLQIQSNLAIQGGHIFFNSLNGTTGDYIKYETLEGLSYFENGSVKWKLSGIGNNFINGGNVGIGTETPQTKLHVAGSIRYSDQLISTVATGTAPLTVSSNTLVTNLNADLLDGVEGSGYVNVADTQTISGEKTFSKPVTISGSVENVKLRLTSTISGSNTMTSSSSNAAIEITATGMNASGARYTPAIKFGSTDPQFVTLTPKMGAAIVGEATEIYADDNAGGMAISFFTSPNAPGTSEIELTKSMSINPSGLTVTANVSANSYTGNGALLTGIVESGTNANGYYVRYSDGTQFCSREVLIDSWNATFSIGSVFRSDTVLAYDFPVSFFGDATHVSAMLHASDNSVIRNNGIGIRLRRGQTSKSLEWSGISLITANSATGTAGEITNISLFATGRWKA